MVMDAKWIYENCKRGTKVTIYRSSKPGPLGKPSRVKMKGSGATGFDPTDPAKNNKYFSMTGPFITIKKASTVAYGKSFSIKAGVTAKNPYAKQKLGVTVYSVKYKAENKKTFQTVKSKTVNTKKPGTYRIQYRAYSIYCGKKAVYKTFDLKVKSKPVPKPAPKPEPEPEPSPAPEETGAGEAA